MCVLKMKTKHLELLKKKTGTPHGLAFDLDSVAYPLIAIAIWDSK